LQTCAAQFLVFRDAGSKAKWAVAEPSHHNFWEAKSQRCWHDSHIQDAIIEVMRANPEMSFEQIANELESGAR
jgi:hypothetical protein